MNSPYKGLMPYSESDAPFFFGRAAEQEIIVANMNVSRLTLLYGASGVGKSSILRAGIAHQLRQDAQKNLQERGTPEFGVVVFSSWRDDPVQALIARVNDEVARTLSNSHPVTPSPVHPFTPSSLTESLATNTKRVGGDLYIILDQFEEYFLYHPDDGGAGSFADEFARVLNRDDLRVNFLLAIREDALAKLDRFKGRIPNLFENYLRMEHLDRDAARDAIVKPLDEYNHQSANGSRIEIEPALVDAVLEQTRTGQVVVGEAGRGGVERAGGDEIETPYLQLVMTRLWAEETSPLTPLLQREGNVTPPSLVGKGAGGLGVTLRLATLERLGGAEKIVRTHLDTTMGALPEHEQQVAASIFNFLVTPSGTKIAHTARDLADYSHVPHDEIAATLEKLSGGDIRILRPVAPPLDQPNEPRYEIFHDVLGAPILDWRTRFVQGQEKIESEKKLAAEKRRVQRLRFGLIGVSLLLLAVIALALFALTQREAAARASAEAEQQKAEALTQRDAAQKAQADALAQKAFAEQEKQNAETAKQNAEAAKQNAIAQQKIAQSGELAAVSLGQLANNPERALLLAREAFSITQTTQTEDALRTALLDPYRLSFQGIGDPIKDARFTPDGKYAITLEPCAAGTLATVTCGSVRIWDTQSSALVSELQMPKGASKLDVSSDGKYIVTANDDAVARVWEIPSGKLVSELRGHQGKINDVHFSPDGKQVVTASEDETARGWDATTGNLVYELAEHKSPVKIAKFSPDSKLVLSASHESVAPFFRGELIVWDARDGAVLTQIPADAVLDAVFSPDSQFVAQRYESQQNPTIWSIATGSKIAELTDSNSGVRSLAYSPDGKLILTGNPDGTIRIFDAFTGANKGILLAHGKGVNDARFSTDGNFVISGGSDNRARWWLFRNTLRGFYGDANTPSGTPESILEPLQELSGHTGAVNTVQFGSDGESILTASDDGTARLWHVNAGAALDGHTNLVTRAVFGPDGKNIATASRDGTTRVWDAVTHQALYTLPADASKVLQYSPDGKQLLTVNDSGSLQIWNAETGAQIWELKNSDGVLRAAFSPNNERVATFSKDGRLRLSNAANGEKIAEQRLISQDAMTVFDPQFTWLTFSPDGMRGAVAVGGDNPFEFDAQTGEILPRVRPVPWNALLTYSPDGAQLAIAYSNTNTTSVVEQSGGFQIWDVAARKLVRDVRGTLPRTIQFSPDGKFILTTKGDHNARVWDAAGGKLLHELKGHTDTVSRAAFSPDGRFIVTASNDKTARLWETATGKLIETLYGHSGILTDASFSLDGKFILTAGDKTARLYECIACASPEDLIQLANARVTRALTCEERVTFLHETIECP